MIEKLNYKGRGMDNYLFQTEEKINELVDAVNKLNNLHPLSTYKAKLKERIKNDLEGDRSLVRAEVYKRVLDLIEKE